MGLFSFLTQDIAIDLGTANTIIIMNDKMVVNEPSIVAVDKKTEKVIAIGERARQMQGKTHEYIKTIRPLRDGVIADFNAAEQMIRGMIKMANGNAPKRIGIIHCVGSRDEKVCNYHCSKLCCITGVKQAIELRELLPDTEIFCFYMDMRMFGPGYEEMYRDAQEKYNIKFVRGRLSEAAENMNKQLQIKVEDTLVGKPLRMTLDMMILLVGMESSEGSRQMADTLGLNLAPNGFIKSQDPHYRNNNTNVEGVFVAGCGSAPMNLTDTLADARSAAMNIIEYVKLKKIL